MNLYIMRHGETVWNKIGIIQGRRNNRLSKEGIKITQKVAKQVKDIPFDVITTSPLMRTVQTANIVNQYHKVKLIKDDDLNEMEKGIFTGRKKNSLSEQEQIIKNGRLKSAGMESYEECFERAKNFVNRIKVCKFKNVLIVTHDRCATFIQNIVSGKKTDFSELSGRDFKNSEIREFTI